MQSSAQRASVAAEPISNTASGIISIAGQEKPKLATKHSSSLLPGGGGAASPKVSIELV